MGSPTRKRTVLIPVRVSPEEKEAIRAQAQAFSVAPSAFLRNLGLGEPLRCTVDQQAILTLLQVNADLGRLGGLLKLWLSGEARARILVPEVRALLKQIEATQAELRARVRAL